ncbi:MAG TPA: saccharopine dehydrogenase-like oxidoreductase [bacterium]
MTNQRTPLRIGVLGAGGLGKAAATIIGMKRQLRLCAICDSKGFVASSEWVDVRAVAASGSDLVEGYRRAEADGSLGGRAAASTATVTAEHCADPIGAVLERAGELDGILIALPNLPNEFIPGVIERAARAGYSLVFTDVLKRTRAVRRMFELDELVKASRSVVLTGCGATPGMLAAAAVLAAQSFIDVERVDIWWGVGIANWDAYKATIREDIAHLPGYNVERAKAMTDGEVDALLDRTDGVLELRHMEHADDVLLERAGVVDRLEQVEVGGVMDTRRPRKPVSTTMTLTGITFDGKRSSHRFILGDETTMAANVIGPALGYLARGLWLKSRGLFGVFGSTDVMPMVVR